MDSTSCDSNNLYLFLQELIIKKSNRDGVKFTIYQLAKAIDMPHSMLIKLLHTDPKKRVNNPRIDTLTKIINFFKEDGFDISLDEVLTNLYRKPVNVTHQNTGMFTVTKSIPLYAMEPELNTSLGTAEIKLTEDASHLFALLCEEDLKPIFKKGSVFIVDPSLKPEDDTLVAFKDIEKNKILILKYLIQENKEIILISFDEPKKSFKLNSLNHNLIMGVVIQVNAKT